MTGDGQRFWARATASLAGQGVALVLGVAASVPLARGLGVTGKGEFAFYSWAISLAAILLGWGWHNAVAAIVSEDPAALLAVVHASRRSLRPAALLLIVVGAGCFAVGATAWGWAAAAAAGQIWGQPASGALIGSGRLAAYYSAIVAQSVVVLAGLAFYWHAQALSPVVAVATVAIGSAVAMAVHTIAAGAGFGPGGEAPSERLALIARHAWLSTLASFLTYRLDVLFVREIAGAAALGVYSTATGVAEIGRMAPNAVGQAAVREIGALSGPARAQAARRVAARGFVASALALAALASVSPWLIPIAYGAAFGGAARLVGWLAPGVAVLSVASVASSWLNVSRRSHRTAQVSWAVAAVSAVLSLGLIIPFGITGAAIASSLAYALQALFTWKAASRE